MAMLDELGDKLETDGVVGAVGTDAFLGFMPETPDNALAIYETGGAAALLGLGTTTGVRLESPSIQVVCRGTAGDYQTPRNLAEAARDAFAQVQATTLGSTLYHWIRPLQSPFLLRRDDKGRVYIGFNCAIDKEPS